METKVTASFAISKPITLTATTPEELEEMVEMFFANGAIAVSHSMKGIV